MELALLGVKGIVAYFSHVWINAIQPAESVELLAAVAEIDADQTPPCCLEIAQLCGRLPLCLNVRCSVRVWCVAEADLVCWLCLADRWEFDQDFRRRLGGGDPVDTEEGHEESDD